VSTNCDKPCHEFFEVIQSDDGLRFRYFDGRTKQAPAGNSGVAVGSIWLVRAKRHTPPFAEQLARMGQPVTPDRLEYWSCIARFDLAEFHAQAAKGESPNWYDERSLNRVLTPEDLEPETDEDDDDSCIRSSATVPSSRDVSSINRRMYEELEREFDAKFEKWCAADKTK
jgi:hypothetical protein